MARPKVVQLPLAEELNDQQRQYVHLLVSGMNKTAAAAGAGYASPHIRGSELYALPHVRAAIDEARDAAAKRNLVTRDMVVQGFLDAVRASATATELVMAWRELGKMLGYYEAEKIEKKITLIAERRIEDLRQLPDDELAALLEIDLKPRPRVIDGTAAQISD
jgi:phage terminase small subunit